MVKWKGTWPHINHENFNDFCSDINECEAADSPCPVGHDCINNLGSYACYCPRGFEGSACEISKLFHFN